MRKLHALLYIITLCITILSIAQIKPAFGQQSLTGDWKGAIDVQGTELIIITHFSPTDDSVTGTIDIPQQGGQDIPLQNISITEDDSVHFEFMAGLGMAKFKGIVKGDTAVAGTFHQNGQTFPFHLKKSKQAQSDTVKDNDKIIDYPAKEIIIQNDSISIGGTLTWPEDVQTNQLVIIISGSGAQNRNGQLPITDFKPYQALAESLTSNGIATFRYDDRGIGESTGSFSDATLSTLASDVDAIIEHFKEDYSKITLLGHSQGGVIAGKVANENQQVDKLILMASTGISLKRILHFQVRQSFQRAGLDSAVIADEIAGREQLMDAVLDEENVEQAQANYRPKFEEIQLKLGSDPAQATAAAKQQVTQLTNTFRSSQVRSLLTYDPTKDLEKLTIPVLVIFGGKDTQVTVALNKEPIEQALESAGISYQTKVFEHANHLFQKAKTGQVQEYATLDNKFVDGLIPALTEWIKE